MTKETEEGPDVSRDTDVRVIMPHEPISKILEVALEAFIKHPAAQPTAYYSVMHKGALYRCSIEVEGVHFNQDFIFARKQ